MVSVLTAGSSGLAGLRAAAVLRLRQFVAGVIDHVPLRTGRWQGNLKTHKAFGKHDDGDQQQAFEQPADEHTAIRKHANRRFSGEALRRAGERWAKSRFEFFPSRRPFDQQVRWLGPLLVYGTIVCLTIVCRTIGDFGNGGNFWHVSNALFSGGVPTSVVCQKRSWILRYFGVFCVLASLWRWNRSFWEIWKGCLACIPLQAGLLESKI